MSNESVITSKMEILSLGCKNFKGSKELNIDAPDGCNLSIYGDNGTGKTTVKDMLCWLFTGKDSQGKGDSQIKPVWPDGQEIHHLETSVYGKFQFDGVPFELKRVMAEDWTRKTNSATETLTGHKTKYYIDGSPKASTEKAFREFVDKMIRPDLFGDKLPKPSDVFQTLTDPFFFSAGLKWEDRRKIILKMSSTVSNDDVLKTDKAFDEIAEPILKHGPTDYKEDLKAELAAIKKEKEDIPVRINEIKNRPEPEKLDPKERVIRQNELDDERKKLLEVRNGLDLSDKRLRLNELTSKINWLKATPADVTEKSDVLRKEMEKTSTDINSITGSIQKQVAEKSKVESRIAILNDSKEAAKKKWYEVNTMVFSNETPCHHCGALPEHQQKITLEAFNLKKSEELEKITAEGFGYKASIEEKQAELSRIEADIEKLNEEKAGLDLRLSELREKLENTKPVIDMKAIEELERQKRVVQMDIDGQVNGSKVRENGILENINDLEARVEHLMEVEAKWKARADDDNRIKELEKLESSLSADFERVTGLILLVNKFIRAWVEMSESSINSLFSLAKIQMFDTLVNGEIRECCNVLSARDGAPFGRGMNNGMAINVGLDIINTLSGKFGLSLPVIIDNAESITELIPTTGQKIRLVVDENAKQLLIKEEKK